MARMTTRDYKRPSRSSSASKLKEFGLGVLVGAVLASAAFLIAGAHARHRAAEAAHAHAGAGSSGAAPHAPTPAHGSSSGSAAAGAPVSSSSAQPGSAQAVAQPPQYDFYRMLPRLDVPVPHGGNHPSRAPPPAANPPARAASAGASYLVQVGSYRSSAEADQVRARLARKGISASVDRFVEGSETWNRVRIGPLSDAELARVRAQLRTANIHALVIRLGR